MYGFTYTVSLLLSMTLFAAASPIETRGSAKAGLSWPGQLDAKFAEPLKAGDLSWYFNWGPTPSNGPGEFVSMIWGPQPDNAPVPAGIPAGAVILGFDEPDGCGGGQSCMTLDAAIREWKKTMNKLADQGHRICAPATAGDGADPNGWLAQFMERCRNDADCRKPSCLRVHTYQSNIDALKGYVSTMHNRFPDLQIWLTEFADHNFGGAVNPTQMQQVHDFMGQVTKWLDETPWIERYAWFGAGNQQSLMGVNPLNRLQNDDWSLTNLGRQYAHGRHT